MFRWIAVLATLLLTGCVTTREVVYRDRYHPDDYAAARYDDRYYDDRYYDDGSYYAPSLSGRGDYYYRAAPRYGYGYSFDAWYWDYPAYYSVFWPLYRSWYDPFRHPGYYYGVTYYPRNYFSIGFHGGWGWPRHGHLYYSPYRHSWVDNYYDWSPWRGRSRHARETPRYGSARNEAERLARMGGIGRSAAAAEFRGDERHGTAQDRYGSTRDARRGADYSGVPAPRQEPGFRGFGVREPAADVRRVGGATRQVPESEGFERPRAGERTGRGPDYGRGAGPHGGWSTGRTPQARREAGRQPEYAPRYERAPPIARGYSRGAIDAVEAPVAVPRSYGRPASVEPYRGEARALPRGYGAVPGGYAPAPRYESRAEPRFEPRPAPSQEARSEARYESRADAAPARSESRRDSDGGVRRVGSNRED